MPIQAILFGFGLLLGISTYHGAKKGPEEFKKGWG
jgi:hypothetical protein